LLQPTEIKLSCSSSPLLQISHVSPIVRFERWEKGSTLDAKSANIFFSGESFFSSSKSAAFGEKR